MATVRRNPYLNQNDPAYMPSGVSSPIPASNVPTPGPIPVIEGSTVAQPILNNQIVSSRTNGPVGQNGSGYIPTREETDIMDALANQETGAQAQSQAQAIPQASVQQIQPGTANYDRTVQMVGNSGYTVDPVTGQITGNQRVDASGMPIVTDQARILNNLGIQTGTMSPQELAQLESSARMLDYAMDARQVAEAARSRTALERNNAALQNTLGALTEDASDATVSNIQNYFGGQLATEVGNIQNDYTDESIATMERFEEVNNRVQAQNQQNLAEIATLLANAETEDEKAYYAALQAQEEARQNRIKELREEIEFTKEQGGFNATAVAEYEALTGATLSGTPGALKKDLTKEQMDQLKLETDAVDFTNKVNASIDKFGARALELYPEANNNVDVAVGMLLDDAAGRFNALSSWTGIGIGGAKNRSRLARQAYQELLTVAQIDSMANYLVDAGNSPNRAQEMSIAFGDIALPPVTDLAGTNNATLRNLFNRFNANAKTNAEKAIADKNRFTSTIGLDSSATPANPIAAGANNASGTNTDTYYLPSGGIQNVDLGDGQGTRQVSNDQINQMLQENGLAYNSAGQVVDASTGLPPQSAGSQTGSQVGSVSNVGSSVNAVSADAGWTLTDNPVVNFASGIVNNATRMFRTTAERQGELNAENQYNITGATQAALTGSQRAVARIDELLAGGNLTSDRRTQLQNQRASLIAENPGLEAEVARAERAATITGADVANAIGGGLEVASLLLIPVGGIGAVATNAGQRVALNTGFGFVMGGLSSAGQENDLGTVVKDAVVSGAISFGVSWASEKIVSTINKNASTKTTGTPLEKMKQRKGALNGNGGNQDDIVANTSGLKDTAKSKGATRKLLTSTFDDADIKGQTLNAKGRNAHAITESAYNSIQNSGWGDMPFNDNSVLDSLDSSNMLDGLFKAVDRTKGLKATDPGGKLWDAFENATKVGATKADAYELYRQIGSAVAGGVPLGTEQQALHAARELIATQLPDIVLTESAIQTMQKSAPALAKEIIARGGKIGFTDIDWIRQTEYRLRDFLKGNSVSWVTPMIVDTAITVGTTAATGSPTVGSLAGNVASQAVRSGAGSYPLIISGLGDITLQALGATAGFINQNPELIRIPQAAWSSNQSR